MADTVRRFHADRRAQKELEELRGRMTEFDDQLLLCKLNSRTKSWDYNPRSKYCKISCGI